MSHWTTAEIETVRALYESSGPSAVARVLGTRSPEAVRKMGKALGLTAKEAHIQPVRMGQGAWTEEDDAVLADCYPSKGAAGCKEFLPNRSRSAIQNRASRLGLKMDSEARSSLSAVSAAIARGHIESPEDEPVIKLRTPVGQWRIDHPISARSVFDLAEAA